MPRALLLILDMVAGHWPEGVRVPGSDLPPPNVLGYARAGLLPAFAEAMEHGVYAYCWNRGVCNTPHGMRYLASGSYQAKARPLGDKLHWGFTEIDDTPTILTSCKAAFPEQKVAAFGSDAWMQTGWWKAADCTMGWGSYFSDFLTMQNAFAWMQANHDWKMVLLYLAQYDKTGNCPIRRQGAAYTEDKHHSLLQLDRYLWMVKMFLRESGWWEETHLCIASDHGCHVGCEVAVAEGRERGIPEQELANYCSNHQEPYDCRAWDFEHDRQLETRTDGPRRTLFMLTGGALAQGHHGRVVPEAEIIDFAPTVAGLMDISHDAQGGTIL